MKNWLHKFPLNALQTFQLLRFATTLFIGILLAKVFTLPTAEIAHYEVLLFLGNFLTFFWLSAGIKSLLSQFPKSKETSHLVLNLAFLMTIFGLLAAAIIYFFQGSIARQLTQYSQIAHLEWLCFFLIFNVPTALIEYLYLLQKKERAILLYGGIVFSTQLLVIIIPLVLNLGVKGVFQGLLLWSIGKFCWLLKMLLDYQKINDLSTSLLQVKHLKQLLYLMFPLSLHMLLGGGMEYVDGFIVTSHFADASTFAIFRYGAKELPLVTILTSALAATLIPLAVDNQTLAIATIKTKVDQLIGWLFPVTMGLMLLSPLLFPIVYNENFAPSARIFNIYLLIISSRLLLPQVIIYARQHNFVLVASALIEVLINLGLSLYWVDIYGLQGIALATVIAYLVNKFILIGYNYYAFQIPLSAYLNVPRFLGMNLFLGITFWISLYF